MEKCDPYVSEAVHHHVCSILPNSWLMQIQDKRWCMSGGEVVRLSNQTFTCTHTVIPCIDVSLKSLTELIFATEAFNPLIIHPQNQLSKSRRQWDLSGSHVPRMAHF